MMNKLLMAVILLASCSAFAHAADVTVNMTWTPILTTTGGASIPAGDLDHRVHIWRGTDTAVPADITYLTRSSAGTSSTVVNNVNEGDSLTFGVTAIRVSSGLESGLSNTVTEVPIAETPPQAPASLDVQL